MQSAKLKVYHFYNGNGGGVWSVIKNLLSYRQHPGIENHLVHAINKKQWPQYVPEAIEGATSQQVCFYNPEDNFYHTSKKLAACLPNEKALVIAHDWIELGMMSNLGLQNKLICFLHGHYDYYYQLAKQHQSSVDFFICIAPQILDTLRSLLPQNRQVGYYRFPVPEAAAALPKITNSIIFIGRLQEQKGYPLLPQIAGELIKLKIPVEWFVVGEGDELVNEWPPEAVVHFKGKLTNEAVQQLLTQMQVLILPSLAEGMPVAMIEAMKAGVVPIAHDLPGGIQQLIDEKAERGYRVSGNDPVKFAVHIQQLFADATKRVAMQQAAKKYADENFSPQLNTAALEELFLKINEQPYLQKQVQKIYGSHLDRQWIANWVVSAIRKSCKRKN